MSPLTGTTRVIARTGDHWRATLNLSNLDDTSAARTAMQSFLLGMRGGVNTAWLKDHSYTQRGSFPATELFTNNTFANGTTGWGDGSEYTGTVADRVWRALRTACTITQPVFTNSSAATVTAYAPLVARVVLEQGRGAFGSLGVGIGSTTGTSDYGSTSAVGYGLKTHVAVPSGTSAFLTVLDNLSTGLLAGDYLNIPWCSLSRCALVDNGPNCLTYSDDFSNAAWTKTRCTAAATSMTTPTGATVTTNMLHEDSTAASTHLFERDYTVSSAAADFCFAVAVKASNRTRAAIQMVETTGSPNTAVTLYIHPGTGTKGTETTGSNWSGLRTFARDLGNGWYYVAIVARKTNAATTIQVKIFAAEGDNNVVFSGSNQDSIRVWRATFAQSSVPVRLTQTVATAAATGTSQALTGGLYTRGWPVSTNGLLYAGDQVQIGNQLLVVTAPVNSDAAGLAFLQTSPALRSAPADNAAVIINQPMAKFMLANNAAGWNSRPGTFSDATIELEEDLR
jgi:hypothetical protein